MTELTEDERAALLALVKAEAFKVDHSMTVENNVFNFAMKCFILGKGGIHGNRKTTQDH